MKKALVIIAVSIFVVSCGKTAEVKEVKTAYVDTSVLMKEYTEAKARTQGIDPFWCRKSGRNVLCVVWGCNS